MMSRNPHTPSRPAGTPERRPPYLRWTFRLVCACLVLLLGCMAGLAYLAVSAARRPAATAAPHQGVFGEMRRDLGGKLLAAGLPEQAAEQYRLYLEETPLAPGRRANMAYTIGELLMDQGRYEEALTWLYQVEMLDPGSELGPEAGSKIVACLERLGRHAQAQYTLDARSGPGGRGPDDTGDTRVVARIGRDEITLRELDEALDALPPWAREPLRDPGRKQAFLEQYVAEELLVRKARRLALDKDPQVRRLADRTFRQLLAQKVLEGEIQEKVRISAQDVERHFEANRDRYGTKEAFRVRMLQAPLDRLPEVRAALDRGGSFPDLAREASLHPSGREGGLVDAWIEEGMDPTGMGDPGALWEALSGLREGQIAGPFPSGDTGILVRVEARRPPRAPVLEEVRRQVEQDLYRERAEQATQELVRQALLVSDVHLYPELLGTAAEGAAPAGEAGGTTR